MDIDAQAVEVAQLSLYLKLLEEETTASAHQQTLFHKEALLPTLNKNIAFGNSLISSDILQDTLFEPAEERALNPMDYNQTFSTIMKTGGFDAIVGNPPYVRPHNLSPTVKSYFWNHYSSFTHKADLYAGFMEKATSLLKPEGLFSYIVSNGWLRLNSFQELRKHILKNYRVLQLVELPYKVFAQASVMTDIFVFQKHSAKDRKDTEIQIITGSIKNDTPNFRTQNTIKQEIFTNTFENIFDLSISPKTESIKGKMRIGLTIGDLYDIRFGLKSGDDSVFLHHQKGLHPEDKQLLRGDDVKRYSYNYKGEYVWYVPHEMRKHRATARPGEPDRFEQPKVLVKDTTSDFAGTFDDSDYYVKDVLIVTQKEGKANSFDLRVLLGLINSHALRFYYRTSFKTIHVQSGELGSLPLPNLDMTVTDGKARHDKVMNLVKQMLSAKQAQIKSLTDRDIEYWDRRCATLDRQIDELVYEMYGLTAEEIAIVEGQ